MRIECTNCRENATIVSRPPSKNNRAASQDFKEQIFRVYVVCSSCGWTGYTDLFTKMQAPAALVEEPHQFALSLPSDP